MIHKVNVKSEDGNKVAKIRYDHEWEEYRVELWIEGTYIEEADYFAYDFEDAKSTAEVMVK